MDNNDADNGVKATLALAESLRRTTPRLDPDELRAYVGSYFALRDHYLSVATTHDVPFYLLETQILAERGRHFRQAFAQQLPELGYYYAMKSNNHPLVAATLLQGGFGLDVSGGPELHTALELNATDIVFSGPGKTNAELELAVSEAERVVVLLDSFGELARLGNLAANRGKAMRVGVRLTTNPQGLWRKFGIVVEDLGRFLHEVRNYPCLDFQGLQFHSSWNMTPAAQIEFIKKLGEVLSELPAGDRQKISFIDIGGGYWPSRGEWLREGGTTAGMLERAVGHDRNEQNEAYKFPAQPIDVFAAELSAAIRRYIFPVVQCRICFEPGRWLCHDAMQLLLSVVDKKAADLVVTDAGTNAIGWERFEHDYFPVLNLSRPALSEKKCHILGSLCTPHDVWGYGYWGEDIQPGDILMIPSQGAYTYSLRQNFIKPLPAVVAL